jgi:hypothetical protein
MEECIPKLPIGSVTNSTVLFSAKEPSERQKISCMLNSSTVYYPDTCPILWPSTPTFLPDWMGNLLPAIGHLTILDICKSYSSFFNMTNKIIIIGCNFIAST